jgi:hypothetical protein
VTVDLVTALGNSLFRLRSLPFSVGQITCRKPSDINRSRLRTLWIDCHASSAEQPRGSNDGFRGSAIGEILGPSGQRMQGLERAGDGYDVENVHYTIQEAVGGTWVRGGGD